MTDTAALLAARGILRAAYASLLLLGADADVRALVTELAAMAHRLTERIEAAQPALDIGKRVAA